MAVNWQAHVQDGYSLLNGLRETTPGVPLILDRATSLSLLTDASMGHRVFTCANCISDYWAGTFKLEESSKEKCLVHL